MPSSVPAALPKSARIFQPGGKKARFENDGSWTGREHSHSERSASSGTRAALCGEGRELHPVPGGPSASTDDSTCFSSPAHCWRASSSASIGKAKGQAIRASNTKYRVKINPQPHLLSIHKFLVESTAGVLSSTGRDG